MHRAFALVPILVAALALSCPAASLVNPGFEDVSEDGSLVGWTVLTGLDAARYGPPDLEFSFDEIIPSRGEPGQGGSRCCLAFPARGTWYCPIFNQSTGNGEPGNDGRKRGKAAVFQTVEPGSGTYRFGAWLRTADGNFWTAAFRLGWSVRTPPEYAHDASTGIDWSPEALAEKTGQVGRAAERGEWTWYQTDPFEVREGEKVTVWIRFDYANENQFQVRWQADNAALVAVAPGASSRTGNIYGIVKDEHDRPVAGGVVTRSYSGGGARPADAGANSPGAMDRSPDKEETRTDGAGTFAFRDVPSGTHELEIRKGGMRVAAMEPNPVVVPPGGAVTVEVALREPPSRMAWRDLTDIYVRNSGFAVSPSDAEGEVAFGWTVPEGTNRGGTAIDQSEGRYGPSLRIEGSAFQPVVRQEAQVVLDQRSGPYRALAWVKTSEDLAPGGAFARLSALDDNGAVVASTEAPVSIQTEWKQVRTGALRVAGTGATRLVVELSGSTSGTVRFDEITLETAGEK